MPFESKAQAGAMFAAASGRSTLGIPKTVGQDFVDASKGEPTSPLPEYVQAQAGHRKKTHRGRRSRGKGPKPPVQPIDHHAVAKEHLANAQAAPTPQAATSHLFKALSSLKKA